MTLRARRWALGINAAIAFFSLVLSLAISTSGRYAVPPHVSSIYGGHLPDGVAGAFMRFFNSTGHFTMWSAFVAGLSALLLARDPQRDSTWMRVLRLDAVLMVTVTAIVYAVVLAPTDTMHGWEKLTNPMLHIVTPLVTVVVWLVVGPRGWLNGRIILLALIIPFVWTAQMLVRGLIWGEYPYDFCDVVQLGYPRVVLNLTFVLLFGLIMNALYWGIDRLLSRRTPQPAHP